MISSFYELVSVVLFLALTSCSPIADRQQRVLDAFHQVKQTASGIVLQARDTAAFTVKTAQEVQRDVQASVDLARERVNRVQSGVQMIREGKDLIREGISQ